MMSVYPCSGMVFFIIQINIKADIYLKTLKPSDDQVWLAASKIALEEPHFLV